MFEDCFEFNSDLAGWDTSNVQDMQKMFRPARNFNSDICGWNVSQVQDMAYMFTLANKFSQNLCAWGIRLDAGTRFENTFLYSGCPEHDDPSFATTPPGPFCFDFSAS